MSTQHTPGPRFFWDGKEVPEVEYFRRKFCLCGALNAIGQLMCTRCLKAVRDAKAKTTGAQHE